MLIKASMTFHELLCGISPSVSQSVSQFVPVAQRTKLFRIVLHEVRLDKDRLFSVTLQASTWPARSPQGPLWVCRSCSTSSRTTTTTTSMIRRLRAPATSTRKTQRGLDLNPQHRKVLNRSLNPQRRKSLNPQRRKGLNPLRRKLLNGEIVRHPKERTTRL